jgi:hypothetical protein
MRLKNIITIAALTFVGTFTASAQQSPYCQADLVFDNNLDFFDVSEFLIAYDNGDPAADFDNSGTLDFFDVSAFLQLFNTGCPDLTDTDGDRLPDFVETDNGIYLGIMATGSDPLTADTDADAIEDGDEVLGTLEGLEFPDSNPVRKDSYVECDWFQGVFQGRSENYRPTAAVEARVVACFVNASTQNPYNLPDGILIHLDYGQNANNTGGNQLPGSPDVIQFDSEFNQYKADHFDPRRQGYYHYAIFANRYNSSTNGSSGIAEIYGDDFMVTMVNYNSTNNMANTIAHELGHNLGLRHGGDENRNRKPNYNSVMNYRHQFPGVDTNADTWGNGVLDYSHGFNNSINELAIDESTGVLGSPVDLNHNNIIDKDAYALNINCSGLVTAECLTLPPSGCVDSTCDVLTDHDDWDNIYFHGPFIATDRRQAPEIIPCDNWPGKQFE